MLPPRVSVPATAIVRLLFWRCPPAISWLVIPVIIRIAIYRMLSAWSRSHVGEKRRKSIPSLTYTNAAPAISFIGVRARIVTAIAHARPSFVFDKFFSVLCRPVAQLRARSQMFFHKTATASRLSVTQPATPGNCLITTLTSTDPSHLSALHVRAASKYGKTPKFAIPQIDWMHKRILAP
jgi:hypothetical protein